MQLKMRNEWDVSLTTAELRLVLQALGGRLKSEDVQEAKELGDHLSKIRASRTKQLLSQNDKLLQNLEESDK